uniref:Kazal-like domain-containing protein n=1 Tax=Timema genevievae TaxID=629358 RepID=A0A7R9PP39_TIMGE|nr:unnamed protein product [Timema genevievae]
MHLAESRTVNSRTQEAMIVMLLCCIVIRDTEGYYSSDTALYIYQGRTQEAMIAILLYFVVIGDTGGYDSYAAVLYCYQGHRRLRDVVIPKSRYLAEEEAKRKAAESAEDEDDDVFYDTEDDQEDDQDDSSDTVSRCTPCPVVKPTFLCGTDNRTYSSLCRLDYHNCIHQTAIRVSCKGFCPCKVFTYLLAIPYELNMDNWARANWAPGQLGARTTGRQDNWTPRQLDAKTTGR